MNQFTLINNRGVTYRRILQILNRKLKIVNANKCEH